MEFTIPAANRDRLEQLLEYLGDTSRYSKYYDGNRAEDFKKCFDIESPWCWKYADLMLRGMEKRELEYAEGHHIVPKCFYGCGHNVNSGRIHNITGLTYPEHMFAHYCAYKCANEVVYSQLIMAFVMMYGKCGKTDDIPSDAVLLEYLNGIDITIIKSKLPRSKKLDEAGRHHSWEIKPSEFNREYREFNRDIIQERQKQFYEENKDRICERQRKYNEGKREEQKQYSREWRLAHPEQRKQTLHNYYLEHKEELAEYKRLYNIKNRDRIREKNRKWREDNHDEAIKRDHERYVKYRDQALEHKKIYHMEHRDEILMKNKKRYAENREKYLAEKKIYNMEHREEISATKKARYDKMVAAGYKYRRDPVTGKRGWVFVGLPEQEVAA